MRPSIALRTALAATLAFPSLAEEPPAGTPPQELAREDLERRIESLAAWTFEPVSIDAGLFLLHLDRRDGSFFIEDRRAGVRWFSSWARRGFASVLVAGEGGAPPRWLRVDRVDGLTAEERKVAFTGGASEGGLPPVRFRFESPAGSESLLLEVEVPAESHGRIERIRILEEALWVSDAAGGGALIPAGAGEWHPASAPAEIRRRLEGIAGAGAPPGPGEAARWSLSALCLIQGAGPLLVRWDDPRAAIEIARKPAADRASFPGRAGIFATIEVPVPREAEGTFSAGIEIVPLGRSEQDPLVSLIQAARERQMRGLGRSTLRWKTGTRADLRPFAGAAILRADVGTGRGFADVAAFAERIHGVLQVDEAAFILGGWAAGGGEAAPSALLPASTEAGGDGGLKECARRVKDLGFIFGLEVDAGSFLRAGAAGAAGAAAAWEAVLEAGRREENLPALATLCAPQILLVRDPAMDLHGRDSSAALDARGRFLAHVRDAFGLAGVRSGSQADIHSAAYFEGFLGDFARAIPASPEPWPFFPAAFGHAARLSAGADPPGPDGAREFLALLLAGEVPVYGIPPAAAARVRAGGGAPADPAGDARRCFSREGGWTAGKGLSAEERFLKNTFEVASRVARTRAKEIFFHHRSVTPDGRVRETRFGFDLRILVNFGPGDHRDPDDDVVLPPMGFLVKHPFLLAFHARRANGVDYEEPAFFVVHSLEGKMYLLAEKTRIYHGFGPDTIQLGGKTFRVEREVEVKIW
jgi:hypothetical protein